MMDISQMTRIWASLSPGLVKPAHDHLPRDDKDDAPKKKDGRARHSNEKKHHHALLVSHLSIDPGMNVGTAYIGSETRWELR